jgi:copper oxidase (laccase) domain-containing protein
MKKYTVFPTDQVSTLFLDQTDDSLPRSHASHFPNNTLVEMEQVHGNAFLELREPVAQPTLLPGVDGVLTSQHQVTLAVRTADCLPILLWHPSGLIGALHAGRKGTEAGLLKNVLIYLAQEKSIQDSLYLWFGPAICEPCYQIDQATDEHYSLIKHNQHQLAAVFSSEHYHLTIDPHCTQHDPALHSYRRDRKNAGRNYSLIAL